MAEKGGKGYVPATNGAKSALKSPVGQDDRSTRSKKGKKVQFEYEDSLEDDTPKSNGYADSAKGSWGKGGKGDKTSNGTKKPAAKKASTEDRRLDQDIPQNSTCLMDCEAGKILQDIQEQMIMLSQDPDIKLPVSFDNGLAYAKRVENYAKPETIKKILERLKKHGVSDSEICLIANISPESVEEVFALIPALKPKTETLKAPLKICLDELSNLKEALAKVN